MQQPSFIETNVDLGPINTLGVPSRAEYFAAIQSVDQLPKALQWATGNGLAVHLLAGGSNLVLGDLVPGLVIQPHLLGRSFTRLSDEAVLVTFSAGENWHQCVCWCLDQGFYGLENLALIPGTAGAAPVQNIGAYGVELEQCFHSLVAFDRVTGDFIRFDHAACAFAYRDSVFKQSGKDRYVITEVTLKLHTKATVNTSYPALAQALGDAEAATPERVFAAVCELRNSRLPTPEVLPNCGSFFKNPIVGEGDFDKLVQCFPGIVHFPVAGGGGA